MPVYVKNWKLNFKLKYVLFLTIRMSLLDEKKMYSS